MAEKHVILICVTVGALSLAAAVLGIIGEATKSRSFVSYDGVNCVYWRTPAFDCGIAAAMSLLTGQVILTAAAGCWGGCRRRSPGHRRAGAVFASMFSWSLAILSICAFLLGALRNESGERRPKEDVASYYQCTVLVAGVFAGASFLSLVAAAVGITSYVATEGSVSSVLTSPPQWSEKLAAVGITSYVATEGSVISLPPWSEKLGKGAVVMNEPQFELHQGCEPDCPTCGGSAKVRTVKELFEDDCGCKICAA